METSENLLEDISQGHPGVNAEVLEQVVVLAVELAREGREGRNVGTIFMVGDVEGVMARSRPMILDPLYGHPDTKKNISHPETIETLKELSQLDGAFAVSNRGVAVSAARYLEAPSADVRVPLGLGSRHMAAAAMTNATGAVGVVVSQSAIVRLFDDGELVVEVLPELWMLSRFSSHIEAPFLTRTHEQVTVRSKAE